jgi:hypothetical protein
MIYCKCVGPALKSLETPKLAALWQSNPILPEEWFPIKRTGSVSLLSWTSSSIIFFLWEVIYFLSASRNRRIFCGFCHSSLTRRDHLLIHHFLGIIVFPNSCNDLKLAIVEGVHTYLIAGAKNRTLQIDNSNWRLSQVPFIFDKVFAVADDNHYPLTNSTYDYSIFILILIEESGITGFFR